jgi:hypothetical protein
MPDSYADGRDFGVRYPNAGQSVARSGEDVVGSKRFDKQRLEPAQIAMQILPVAAQIDDRIAHQLAGPVVSRVTAAVGPDEIDLAPLALVPAGVFVWYERRTAAPVFTHTRSPRSSTQTGVRFGQPSSFSVASVQNNARANFARTPSLSGTLCVIGLRERRLLQHVDLDLLHLHHRRHHPL